MNVIFIMNDTFRRDHLASYGAPAPWERPGHAGEPFIRTPNLDRLAAESAVFDRFYIGSYPTVPCRTDLFTGRFGFPFRGWQPLESGDVILSELVRAGGYTPVMIFDTPMLGADAYNFMRGFAGWEFIRGQHADRWNVDPVTTTLPAAPHKLKNVAATHLYLRNAAHRRSEADWMAPKTLAAGMDWLERNRSRDDFVLWLDMWDPHEPFDAPDFDLARYADPAFDGETVIYPRYGRHDFLDAAEANQIRASYAALVTLVDRWVGRLLDTLETLGLDRNTLVLFSTDHGHLFGEHELGGKPTGPLGQLYEVTTRIPLLIRHPTGLGAGQRIGGLAQHADILPTILEFLDLPIPGGVHGQSLWPLIRGETADLRDVAVSGRNSRMDNVWGNIVGRAPDAQAFDGTAGLQTQAEPLTLTTRRWAYLCPTWAGGRELYDLKADPSQTHNLIHDRPDVAADLHARLIGFLEGLDAPAEMVEAYRDPESAGPRPALLAPEATLFCIDDGRGHQIAFPTRAEAEQCLVPSLPDQVVRETSFGSLREQHPRALVHLHEQYYWAEDLGVKLHSLDLVRLRVTPKTTYLFVRLLTDDGRSGLGDASSSTADAVAAGAATELFNAVLIARPLDEIGALLDRLREQVGPRPTLPQATACSGLEQALWDLRGQQLGLPLHALFGGARRREIPLYANINRGLTDRSAEAFAERARAAAAAGFQAVKCAPFDGVEPKRLAEPAVREAVERGIGRVLAVREAIGTEIDLMVDCHERFDVETAVAVAERLRPAALRWFEEPVDVPPAEGDPAALDAADLARIAARCPFPLAAGEKLFGVAQLQSLMAGAPVHYVMPDAKHCGGLWELIRIGAVAEAAGRAFSPHNPGSAVATLATGHVAAALPAFDLLEFQWGELDWRADLIDPPEQVENGRLRVPDRPGLGAALNDRLADRYRISFED